MPICTPLRLLLLPPPRGGKTLTSTLASSSQYLEFSACQSQHFRKSFGDTIPWLNCRKKLSVSAFNEEKSSIGPAGSESIRKSALYSEGRKIVDHIFLLRTKEDLSDDQETDMLDYLYTSQYQMSGILAVSLGRITDPNADGFTHAVYMRFQRKEDLAKFYMLSYSTVLKEHVLPYCNGLISLDYESEVQDDILPIFRRGEEFNYGVEFVLLISVNESALANPVNDALAAFTELTLEFDSVIVQATQGSNINHKDREYTHAAVIRFPSSEAMEMFRGSSQYKNMWKSHFQPIVKKALEVYFSVDPVGTEIM